MQTESTDASTSSRWEDWTGSSQFSPQKERAAEGGATVENKRP